MSKKEITLWASGICPAQSLVVKILQKAFEQDDSFLSCSGYSNGTSEMLSGFQSPS